MRSSKWRAVQAMQAISDCDTGFAKPFPKIKVKELRQVIRDYDLPIEITETGLEEVFAEVGMDSRDYVLIHRKQAIRVN